MELGFAPAETAAALRDITDPWALLAEAAGRTLPGRFGMGTSGQLTGTALLVGAARHSIPLRVFTVDTLRLFPETIAYFDELEARFGIAIERRQPDPEELRQMLDQHGEYLFFDSKAKQEYCCEVRKVRPNRRALDELDIWVSGLRRDQSRGREQTSRVEIVPHTDLDGTRRELLKLNPLVDWSEQDVRRFLEAEGAPTHPLLQPRDDSWFYESLGCVTCTTPQARWEPRRAGRWRWFNDRDDAKECGIHVVSSGDGGGI